MTKPAPSNDDNNLFASADAEAKTFSPQADIAAAAAAESAEITNLLDAEASGGCCGGACCGG